MICENDIKSELDGTFDECYKSDLDYVLEWSDELYSKLFGESFKDVTELYLSIDSKRKPITDSQLEWILCDLPIKLFNVSEILNNLRLEIEVIKLKKNTFKTERKKVYLESKIKKSDINDYVDSDMVWHETVLSVYKSVASRVEQELSFSRELIMGAKKIWDSRRSAERSNPIGEVVPEDDLPDYVMGG